MKITEIKLYRISSGNLGEKGAQFGESQYWGGGWQTGSQIANPMSVYPKFARVRTLWMGPGQDPYAIEILTDEGVTGCAVNYGCLLYTSPSPRDLSTSRMPSSA